MEKPIRQAHEPFSCRTQSGGFRPAELATMRQICENAGLKLSFTDLVRFLLSEYGGKQPVSEANTAVYEAELKRLRENNAILQAQCDELEAHGNTSESWTQDEKTGYSISIMRDRLTQAFKSMFSDEKFGDDGRELSNQHVIYLLLDYAEADPFATIDQEKCFPLAESAIKVYETINTKHAEQKQRGTGGNSADGGAAIDGKNTNEGSHEPAYTGERNGGGTDSGL